MSCLRLHSSSVFQHFPLAASLASAMCGTIVRSSICPFCTPMSCLDGSLHPICIHMMLVQCLSRPRCFRSVYYGVGRYPGCMRVQPERFVLV
ncbi:hypothetical protein BD309DRAFT_969247 [Dichomitus squalens]|nr:hypothetical protein BD309DRAFT_969247 [Dichomitus squalens]